MRHLSFVSLFLVGVGCSPASGDHAGVSSGAAQAGGNGSGGAPAPVLAGLPSSAGCSAGSAPLFANAICVCEELAQAGTLVTVAPSGGAANVGVNGRSSAATGTIIDGSYVAFGGLALAGDVKVKSDLVSAGDITGAGTLRVGHDLGGASLAFAGDLDVAGTLRVAHPTAVPTPHAGTVGPFTAPASAPCGCDPASLFDVAGAVANAALHNDDAARGFSADGLDLLGQQDRTLTSGVYYAKSVTRVGKGKVVIDGAVKLYIDGSIVSVGENQIVLKPGATLDLFVTGLIATAGSVDLGDPSRPDAFRLYLGGEGSASVTAGSQSYHGLIYAPRATVAFAGVTEVVGAVFAKQLVWAGDLRVTYASGAGAASPAECQGPSAPTPGPTTPPAGDTR